MRIYRGPAGQKFEYANSPNVKLALGVEHELVDEFDLSVHNENWHGTRVIRAKIDKNSFKRSSVVHILIDETDIIALHQGLMEGLRQKRQHAEEASRELSALNLNATFGISQNELSDTISGVFRLLQ